MDEEKITSGRGGKREGAGRPKGTTKEKVKKNFSFRLSEEEEKAVRELLARMRDKLVLLFCLFAFCVPTLANTLNGAVTYTEETARKEAFKDVYKHCPYPSVDVFNRSIGVTKINEEEVLTLQEFKSKLFGIIPYKTIAVVYKDLPNWIFHYERNRNGTGSYRGVAVDVITNNRQYPYKVIKYDAMTGKLLSVTLLSMIGDDYVFDKDGKLIGHWQNDKEIINKNMKRKVIYSAP